MELLPPTLLSHLLNQRTSPGSRASRSSSRGEGAAPCRRRGALQLPAPAGTQAGTRHMGRSQLTGWPCPRLGSVHLRLLKGALAERNASGYGRTRRFLLLGRHRCDSFVRSGRRRVRNNWRRDRGGSRVGHERVRAQFRFPALRCRIIIIIPNAEAAASAFRKASPSYQNYYYYSECRGGRLCIQESEHFSPALLLLFRMQRLQPLPVRKVSTFHYSTSVTSVTQVEQTGTPAH